MEKHQPGTDAHAAWLAQVQEPIIDPERRICDPHHHLWDRNGYRYLLHELLADVQSGHRVVSTVHIECASMYRATGPAALSPVGETEFVNGIAAMSASGGYGDVQVAAGIVGFADLCLGSAVGEVLDAHCAASPRFRGIRHAASFDESDAVRNAHTNPPKGLYYLEAFRAGFKELAPRNLSFEAWQYHHQLRDVIDLARAFPDTRIILNHFSGPLGIGPYAGRREEIFQRWRRDLAELAKCENVVAKLGGLVMPVNGFGFHYQATPPSSDALLEATGPYYREALACFGAARCMFESNFPVDKASVSYPVLWNAFKKLVVDGSEAEKDALFHDTAAACYRLS